MQQPGMNGENALFEKLAESMKRSAMSRTIVRQLSGHSRNTVMRQNSARGVSRQNSGQTTNARGLSKQKQLSGRNLVRASSGRPIPQRARSGSMRGGDVVSIPIQGVRGVNRHSSHSAAVGSPQLNSMGQMASAAMRMTGSPNQQQARIGSPQVTSMHQMAAAARQMTGSPQQQQRSTLGSPSMNSPS